MKRTIVYASVTVLLVLIFIIQETAGGGKNTLSVPSLPETVNAITLEQNGQSIELKGAATGNEEDGADGQNFADWTVGQNEYPADAAVLAGLVSAVRDIEKADVISDREGYGKFGLDGNGVRTIRFFSEGKEVLVLRIGNVASSGGSVYALIDDHREVVMLPQDVADRFSLDAFDFREKQMEALAEDDIDRIEIQSADWAALMVGRSDTNPEQGEESDPDLNGDGRQWSARYAGAAETEEIDPGRFRDFFTELADLRAAEFPGAPPEGEPWASLSIHQISGERVIISLWPPNENSSYPARISTNPYIFTLPQWKVRRLLLGVDRYFEEFEKD